MRSDGPRLMVGPLRFVFMGASAGAIRYSRWPYSDFYSPNAPPGDAARAEISIEALQGDIVCPARPPDFSAAENWTFWSEDQFSLFRSEQRGGRRSVAVCRVARDWTRATLFLEDDPSESPLCFPLDQVLTWSPLARCGGLLLHAAGVAVGEAGVALAGRSGAGKSTLAGLCAGAGWPVLNDDRVAVYPWEGGWRLAGTPWPGSGRRAVNRTLPLRAVYALCQDSEDRAEPLEQRAARDALLPVASIPWFDETSAEAALRALDRLIREVPVRRLRFSRSPSAVEALKKDAA